MKKKLIIGLAVVVVLAVVVAILLTQRPAESQAGSPGVAVGEISIRNVTADVVSYEITPADSPAPPQKRLIKPGAIHRLPTDTALDISFERAGRTTVHRLSPGKPYSFRLNEDDHLEIYEGSHGWQGVEDLAPFVATPMEVVDKMLDMAEVKASDVLYDLGCGDGRIVINAARKFGCRGVGIDIDPQRIRESRQGAKKAGVQKLVEFREADAMKVDITRATVVSLYLLPESNALLRPKFENELKPGTNIVTHNYRIPGWEAKEVRAEKVPDMEGKEHSIFLYKR
ncbi:MAG TPA: class I SAM-dependent methyltransferase [Acidobacteriota bacterium]